MLKIDIYPHIVPKKYKAALYKAFGREAPTVEAIPTLWDLDYRFRITDKYPGYVEVLNLSGGPVEIATSDPKQAVELAKIGNDELAELVNKYPEHFVGAVATLPLNDIDAALREIDRAIKELRLRGILLWSPIKDKPLDSPEFMPIYEKMSNYNLPILIHPWREFTTPDYATEKTSKYMMWSVWGWPYETTLAMTRLVFSGVFDKYPNLKFVTHHAGAMVPFFAQRIAGYWDYVETRLKRNYKAGLRRPLVDYFRLFYNDTAIYGNTPGLMCAYSFFGAEHLLFGTDIPYDSQNGNRYIRDTIAAIDQMDISPEDKKKIYEDNARSLFQLPV